MKIPKNQGKWSVLNKCCDQNKDCQFITTLIKHLDLSCIILRADLHFYAYKLYVVVLPTDNHKLLRVEFCNCMLIKPESWGKFFCVQTQKMGQIPKREVISSKSPAIWNKEMF